MRVTSVNTAEARTIEGFLGTTGIAKKPRDHPVELKREGVTGDAVCNKAHHGGPDQAVYIYGGEDYAFWEETLGRELEPGTFGENLTIEGLASAAYGVGDHLKVGTAVLEITAPRIPCSTLAARMGDPRFPLAFREAERPGLYARVVREGVASAGDEVTVIKATGPTVPIAEIFRENYNPEPSATTLRRFLAAPIDIRTRQKIENTLQRRGEAP